MAERLLESASSGRRDRDGLLTAGLRWDLPDEVVQIDAPLAEVLPPLRRGFEVAPSGRGHPGCGTLEPDRAVAAGTLLLSELVVPAVLQPAPVGVVIDEPRAVISAGGSASAISGTFQMDEGFTVEGQPGLPTRDDMAADLESDPDYRRMQEYKAVPGRVCTPASGQVMTDMGIPEYGGARVRVFDETARQIGAGTMSATDKTKAGGCQLTFEAELSRVADFYTIEIAGERAQESSQRELESRGFEVSLASTK